MPAARALLAAGVLCFAPQGRLAAQATDVSVLSGVDFDLLLPGVSATVLVTDAARRGEVWISGRGNVDVRLMLPTVLTAPNGAQLPLRFAYGDAATASERAPTPAPFDPNTTARLNITSTSGSFRVYIGGTAVPEPGQPAGTYTSTISLVVTRVNQ
jgi:hypothetical protein